MKRQLEAVKRDFKKLEDRFQVHEAVRYEEDHNGGASCSLNVEVEKSLDFLGKEYDDLGNSDADTKITCDQASLLFLSGRERNA